MDRTETARAYYRSLDEHDYETLASLLADDFRHVRPDQTLEGADRFVAFMRDERPKTDTSHPIAGVWDDGSRVVVQGQLTSAEGDGLTEFVDLFAFAEGRISSIRTYTQ